MPRPYSSDLRGRVLAAWDGGERPSAVAERFRVARATVYLWLRQRRDEGRTEAERLGGGPKPTIRGEAEAALVRLVEDRSDRTLAEYADGLAAAPAPGGVRVHPWTVGRALRRLGRTRKKRRPCVPPSRTRRPSWWRGGTGGGGWRLGASPPIAWCSSSTGARRSPTWSAPMPAARGASAPAAPCPAADGSASR